MDPIQAKPVRKRRRWPIVAFVLVLVSMVSWWNWPRGDARFVGFWSVHFPTSPSSTAGVHFRSDGIAEIYPIKEGAADRQSMRLERWRVDGDTMYMVPVADNRPDELKWQLVEFITRIQGRTPPRGRTWIIEGATDGTFRLRLGNFVQEFDRTHSPD
jgi:hypothetical protein